MEIVQVTPRYLPYFGGVEEYVRNISERLAKRHSITVLTCDPSGNLPRKEEINKVTVRRFRALAPHEAYYFSLELFWELKKVESDVVHAHSYHAFPLLFSVLSRSKKFVVTPYYHGQGHTKVRNLFLRLYHPLGRIPLKRADKIVCISKHEKSLLKNHFKIEDRKMVVVPVGINVKEFEKFKKKKRDETQNILCVSRLEKYKGIHHVIQSLSRLDPVFHLDIIGRGSYKKKLVQLVQNLHLDYRVHFSELLPRDALLQKYAEASVFVLLSTAESYGMSVAEALAFKTPCIVANASALSEWVDNINCFGIDLPVDVERLAHCIETVSRITLKKVDLPTWEETAKALECIYKPLNHSESPSK